MVSRLAGAITVGAAIAGSVHPLPADATRYGVYGAGLLLAVSLAWGCYHGIARRHTLADRSSPP